MGTKTFAVFERIPQTGISESDDERQGEQLSGRYRGTGTGSLWKDCRADEAGTGNHRTAKGRQRFGWVGRMNNIQACTRKIVDKEIIYQ